MRKYLPNSKVVCAILLIAFIGSLRPHERTSSIQTPDEKHIHQVYATNPIKTEFVATAQGLSGISIARKESTTSNQAIIVHIYTSDNVEIPSSFTISPTELKLSFVPQAQSKDQKFSVTIDTPNVSKQDALLLPYESDSTKYPENNVWQNEIKKQGTLGITQYERPTIALSIARWLALPHQRTLWIGVFMIVAAMVYRQTKPGATPPYSPSYEGGVRGGYALSSYVLIFLSIIIVYWPATKLFFYSDDVPILARTEVLKGTNPLLLFTPYQYTETDQQSNFGFDFWRPISFGVYPFLLSLLTGPPNAFLYYLINVALFAITGCLVFAVATHLLKEAPFALLATAIWTFHSTKLGVLYWWSSSQDILASLFAMACIVFYLKGRHRLAILCYMLGMFSKEYVIVTPLIIAGIEILQITSIKKIARLISSFIIAAGIFLVVNTAMLGNPWILKHGQADTYALTTKPAAIIRNIIVYTSATAEARLWPKNDPLHIYLELWRAKTSGPYYPGALLIIGVLGIMIALWRKKNTRNLILFGSAWWIFYLGPILLLANDWKPRWLTLSVFGLGLCIAILCKHIRLPQSIAYAITLLVCVYGFYTARTESLTRFHREQSDYTRTAYNQLQKQQKEVQDVKRIILIGITDEQQTSLNAYLFRVYAKNQHADIIYRDSQPATKAPGDVIINMTGFAPYYPESEK